MPHNLPDRRTPNPWDQTHVDIGALAQRVTGTEKAIENLSNQFSSLANSFQNQMAAIGSKIDAQQSAYAASKNTNWPALISAGAVTLTVIGGFFFSQMQPINNDLARHERENSHIAATAVAKDDFKNYIDSTSKWIESLRDRLRADEDGAVTQRQIKELVDRLDDHNRLTESSDAQQIARLEKQLDSVDANQIKRPEISALLATAEERISTLSIRMNEIQSELNGYLAASKK